MILSEEIVYNYLDSNIKIKREKALKKYLKDRSDEGNLAFYDLDMYDTENSFKNIISREINRSKLDSSIILTKYQIEIINILQENNLFLSAPTSFGKTFVMLEFIKRNTDTLKNIVFIIPTLALMNELLKKIYDSFGDKYNICINNDEVIEERNIFVFVPERSNNDFIEIAKSFDIDLLVFDEIYKLQGTKKELSTDDRLIYMNKVYLDLVHIAKKVALLGPYINNVEFENTNLNIIKYYTNYMPVYNEINVLNDSEQWSDKISYESQLIYFKSPQSIYKNIDSMLNAVSESKYYIELYKDEIDFLEKSIGKEWYVIDLLKRGIGIHHGKTPMFLRKFYEIEYNKKNIKVLLCTDTLMEGINTPTESLLIVDRPGNLFKLNNLIGRVGRLNPQNPVIGNVTLCDKDILQDFINNDSWLDLKIRAEDKEVLSDDEVLYLNKKYSGEEKNKEYNEKIKKLKEQYNVDSNDMIKNNLELDKTIKLFDEGIVKNLQECENLYNCVVCTTDLIPGPSYYFKKNRYKDLKNSYEYLPYKQYILDILSGKTYKQILGSFNQKYNVSKDRENMNIFIDSLYNLNNYIKFKFSKIINYIEVAQIENISDVLNRFIALLSNYNKMETSFKILDDLGIENNDAQIIIDTLKIDTTKISASKMMDMIRNNKDDLAKKVTSPFSMNNIMNI